MMMKKNFDIPRRTRWSYIHVPSAALFVPSHLCRAICAVVKLSKLPSQDAWFVPGVAGGGNHQPHLASAAPPSF